MTPRQVRHRKKAFLERFAAHGNVSRACREVGVVRGDVYRWKERDDRFLLAWTTAELEATERLEEAAYERAVTGVTQETPIYSRGVLLDTVVKTEYSDLLLMFLLKARAPEKYRERYDVKHGGRLEQDVRVTVGAVEEFVRDALGSR